MKQLIAYYSYTGDTAKLAAKLAEKRDCDILEIKDAVARPGKLKAYTAGCFAAIKGKSWEIEPLARNLEEYDRITILAPVWAGGPAPQINSLIDRLPDARFVEIIMVSASGKSSCKQKLEERIKAKGCAPVSFRNVKGKQAEPPE